MQRSLLLFENAIKSPITLTRYMYYLGKFLKFYHLKDYDSFLSMDSQKLQVMIEDYVMDLKKRVNPNSVPTYITPIQTFLDVNEFELKWKKIHRLYPAKIKSTGRKAYTTEDLQKMLALEHKRRNRVIIHLLASGPRKGALPDLRIKHLKKMPLDCYAILFYENSTSEYCSFLTPEASKELDRYFEQRKADRELFGENSPIIRSSYQIGIQKVVPMTDKAIDQTVDRIVKRAGVREKTHGNRYDKMLEHAFRKRFETIVKLNKDIPIAVAEKLIGHKAYYDDRGNHIQLDENYVVPEVQQLFEFFKKVIPELTIDPTERQNFKIHELEQDKSELEKKNVELVEYKKKIDQLWADKQRMENPTK